METKEQTYWGFGYGSNMNVKHLKEKKNVIVLDHVPGILSGYRMAFNLRVWDLIEPGMGGLVHRCPQAKSTVKRHNVIFKTPSNRTLLHFHDFSMDKYDNGGKPPFPLLSNLTAKEEFYLECSLDQMMFSVDLQGNITLHSEIIGYHKEFKEQQDSGKSNFKFPNQ